MSKTLKMSSDIFNDNHSQSPSKARIRVGLLKRILNQAGITREEWLDNSRENTVFNLSSHSNKFPSEDSQEAICRGLS
ncbi:MAG UNVERIFIED_CONTAM: hypothetical protein LVR29_07855 [Microcystis novacekii LVE1205-3]